MPRAPLHLALSAALIAVGAGAATCPIVGEGEGEGEGEGAGCRTQADCGSSASCASANDDGPRCGIGPTDDECATAADCGVSEHLTCDVTERGTCTEHQACIAPCNDVAGVGRCATDETCTADGLCVPTSCAGGFVCSPWKRCTTPAGTDRVDAHGCVAPACASDGDCGAGEYCVTGNCAPALGSCELPVP
jgi:hypothetical protein